MSVWDSVWDRLFGASTIREVPALTGPETDKPPPIAERYDGAASPAVRDGTGGAVAPGWRRDSTFNPLTFLGGSRDKGAAARPSRLVLPLSDEELQLSYSNSGIAKRIVDLLPDEATRKGWSCPDVPATEDQRLNVYETVADAAKMARLFGGAAVLLVTEDDVPRSFRGTRAFQRDPMAWLAQPLDIERVGALRAVHVFDPYEAQPVEAERDLRLPGYRLPRTWSIGADGISARVHASRILYFRGQKRPPSQAWGAWNRRSNIMPDASVLQAIWDEVRHLTETHKGGAVLAQELSQSILKIGELAPKQTGDEAGAFAKFLARLQRSMSVLGMVVIGPNDEFDRKATPATGFKDLSEASQAMLATVLGWPRSMLSGEPPSGLSSDDQSGLERERKIVSSYQEQKLRRPLEQLYSVVYAAQDGPTGGAVPDEWSLDFRPLNEPSDQEVADLRKTVAETDAIYINSGVYAPEVVAENRFGAEGWELDLDEVPVPDPADEAAIAAARALLERGADPGSAPPRADAIAPDSCCILVPAADPGLRDAVERAIGQRLVVEGSPHVTVLYLGAIDEAAVPEVVDAVEEEAARAEARTLERGTVRAFPAGPDGTPIVVEFDDTWAVQALHDALLTQLAHLVALRQHRRYRPHLTIGYAPQPLTVEAAAALGGVDASAVRVPISYLAVSVGGRTEALIPAGGA